MQNIRSLVLPFCLIATLASANMSPRDTGLPYAAHPHGVAASVPHSRSAAVPSTMLPAVSARLNGSVTPAVCPEPQAVCGYVTVPLYYEHPKGPSIQIYFEQYVHKSAGPAISAIFANFGGPGVATTNFERDFSQFLFAPNSDVHDLVLIDDRGSGRSATIDCPQLQHGTASLAKAEADCATKLGNSAGRYGSGDIAKDMDAVRAALGYEKIDYFGASYGGMDVSAYATRFGTHLRSIVLDAPVGAPVANEFGKLHSRTHSDPRMVRLVCARSLICGPEHEDAEDADNEFAELVESIREHPVEGNTFDANGTPMYVRVDETALLNFVVTYPQSFVNTGEILAAARALKDGDAAPLLRLAAEGTFSNVGDSGDPTIYSNGDFYASRCVTTGEAWSWSDSISKRLDLYTNAVQDLDDDYFAPFSRSAATGILFSEGALGCIWWQDPPPATPLIPPHAAYPSTPTLVLAGDIDNRVPIDETRLVAAVFPRHTFLKILEAGHETVGYAQCARDLVARFIETLSAGDTSCTQTPEFIFPAVGKFPLHATGAHAAEVDKSGFSQISIRERKVVTVAVAAAIDALQRSIVGSGTGVGLRGGTFQTTYGATWITMLANCAFSADVLVNGPVIWAADNSVDADLAVGGPGTAGGTLHVQGFWRNPGPVGMFNVSGTLGGKRVSVLVPEA